MPTTESKSTFESELTNLLNRHSQENGSDSPDFVLSRYLIRCLEAYNFAVYQREQWHGITVDEISRCKDARKAYIKHHWPLINIRFSRNDCLRWMESHDYPKPPRSACVYCPYHSDREWRRLKTEEPEAFDQAVQYEHSLKKLWPQLTAIRPSQPALHRSCKPLYAIDFSTEEERGQLNMFNNECEGMCGV